MNQEQALAILKTGRNVFLTGSAGTGKTYVLNQYIRYLKARRIQVSVTASTGIAATHIEGTTIHAWCGMGIRDHLSPQQLLRLREKKYLQQNTLKTKVLIIDEISMLHRKQFELVNAILKAFREKEEAFGGVQLVLCGDFFQLPPVGNPAEQSRDKFSFMAPSWLEAQLNVCYLTKSFRQSDEAYRNLLNEIRAAKFSETSTQLLRERHSQGLKDEVTRLFTHNQDVDQVNEAFLSKVKGSKKTFLAVVKGNLKMVESVKKSIMAPERLHLKKGAKVMFVRNNYEKGYLNGSTGEVMDFNSEGVPKVRLHNGYEVVAEREEWRIEDDSGKLLVSYAQIPLRLAWAITVHKSQGMTLDRALMDLSKTFERGQGYVALSRVKSLEGLFLEGINAMALQVDPLALKADLRFQELSEENERAFDEKLCEELAKTFVRASGGVTDASEIEDNAKRLKKGEKVGKKSTYLITKQLIEEGLSLEQICKQRELTYGTLCTHLLKIADLYPQVDLKRFKPKTQTLNKVRKARKELLKKSSSDRVSLKPLFAQLQGELSYNEIKLALLYL